MLNFYYGEECPHCHHMMPLVDKLIGEGREIQKFETWHNEEHAAMLEKADGGVVVVCRSFSQYRHNQFICGAADEERVRAWADGKTLEE